MRDLVEARKDAVMPIRRGDRDIAQRRRLVLAEFSAAGAARNDIGAPAKTRIGRGTPGYVPVLRNSEIEIGEIT
jgi:hypothetical protein